jgi:hypothetical protein
VRQPIKWRDYDHDTDYEAVVILHKKMQERVGRDFDMPHPNQRPVLLCMVGETDGVITHVVYGEAEMEICAMGEDPMPAEELAPVVARFHEVAQKFALRIARAFVPRSMIQKANGRPSAIARILKSNTEQFHQDSDALVPFFYWIPPGKGVQRG